MRPLNMEYQLDTFSLFFAENVFINYFAGEKVNYETHLLLDYIYHLQITKLDIKQMQELTLTCVV